MMMKGLLSVLCDLVVSCWIAYIGSERIYKGMELPMSMAWDANLLSSNPLPGDA